jgi:CheY-like chemotaxis protein
MISRSTPLQVLVVDDDVDIQDVMVLMVKRCGHLAHRACDGVEAIEALVEHTYDLVILDLRMPRMTGEDVLRWLQQHPERAPDTRVIVVTGSAEEHRARLEALGAHAVVPKPLGLQQLSELLSREEAQRVVAD